jgi:hypothetical protein
MLGVVSYLCYGLLGLWLVATAVVERERRARRADGTRPGGVGG